MTGRPAGLARDGGDGSPRSRDESRYLEPDIETIERTRLAELQHEVLMERLQLAHEHSPLYRERWNAAGFSPSDVASIAEYRAGAPIIRKSTVQEFRDRTGDPFGGILCLDEVADLTCITSSSGTTGEATLFAERWDRYSPLQVSYLRDLWELGLRPGDRVIDGPNTFKRGGEQDAFSLLGLVPVMVNTWAPSWDHVLGAVQRHGVAFLHVLGPGVIEIDRLSRTVDLREAMASVKGVSFAGEPLGSRMIRRFREDWDVDLFMYTSCGDTGVSWECQEHDGYHVWEDRVLLECLAPDGDRPVAEGEVGELVVTDLDNVIAPLLRFRTDDLIRMSTQRCACGRTHARIWPLGRKGDLTIVGGRSVLPIDVWSAVEALPETMTGLFQIIRTGPEQDEFRIRVGHRPSAKPRRVLEDQLRGAIAEAIGVEPTIELVTEDELLAAGTGSKIPRVVDR